jgi:Transport and Golgi organisation 2
MKDWAAMCTVVVSLAPQAPVPLLLLGVRDEFAGRPWRPPARHWSDPAWSPLIGGIDDQAGGTWLAVHPDQPRVGCILNGRGKFAPPDRRRSRGELPLRAAAEGPQALQELRAGREALARYDPFYLVCADLDAALLLGWDGMDAELTELGPATHVLTNAGHMYPPAEPANSDEPKHADEPEPPDMKAARFGPKFAARRPSGDPAATLEEAWGDWLALAAGDGLAVTEPGAIIVRRDLPDGRVWGSTSVTLIALAAAGRLRYDFQPDPAGPGAWYSVPTSEPSLGAAAARTRGKYARFPGRTSAG